MYKKFLFAIMLFLLSSCIARSISQKGYVINKEDIESVNIGITNKENALKILGYPLDKSYFDDDIWIYYSYKMKEVLFFKPKITEQKILIVEFDKETNLVKNLSLYDIKSKNNTLNIGSDINKEKSNAIKDVLSNIGQFSI